MVYLCNDLNTVRKITLLFLKNMYEPLASGIVDAMSKRTLYLFSTVNLVETMAFSFENHKLCFLLFIIGQTGDGRTHLNDKYGY